MISLLTSLKPFTSAVSRIQEHALSNWRRLHPALEIIVYGDGEGISDRALRFGARHVPDIPGNAKGIPDFAAIAEHASLNARHDIQVYLNGDILLPPDFIPQIEQVSLRAFLLTGQRIDLAREAAFNVLACDWTGEIRRCASSGQAQLHPPSGQDYFAFPRGLWKDLPPLTVGRGSYDSALLAFCLRRRIPIIDATWSIHVVHQWHDYSHLKTTKAMGGMDDTRLNKRLHDIEHSNPDIEDADWRLIYGKVIPCRGSANQLRRLEIFLRYRLGLKRVSYFCRTLTRGAWMAGFLKPRSLPVTAILSDETHSEA